MVPLVDAHCHLADPKLTGDLDAVLKRAAAAGIETIISVGALGTIDSDRLTVEIARRHGSVWAVVGVHPHHAADCDAERIAALRELARSRKVVAIGESGLDFFYMNSPAEAQEASLRKHLELASELELPLVMHCRAAERRLSAILHETGIPARGAMIHCFNGDVKAARDFLALGLHISLSGILTFNNTRALRAAAQIIPEDRLTVESDAPYLAPEPHRGRRNEPAFVRHTLDLLAELRGTDADALAARVSENARRFFAVGADGG
jgi:TatD DNase family protein